MRTIEQRAAQGRRSDSQRDVRARASAVDGRRHQRSASSPPGSQAPTSTRPSGRQPRADTRRARCRSRCAAERGDDARVQVRPLRADVEQPLDVVADLRRSVDAFDQRSPLSARRDQAVILEVSSTHRQQRLPMLESTSDRREVLVRSVSIRLSAARTSRRASRSAGQIDEGARRAATNISLRCEEVVDVPAGRRTGRRCSSGSWMLSPTERPPASADAGGRLHQPCPPPIDREASLAAAPSAGGSYRGRPSAIRAAIADRSRRRVDRRAGRSKPSSISAWIRSSRGRLRLRRRLDRAVAPVVRASAPGGIRTRAARLKRPPL